MADALDCLADGLVARALDSSVEREIGRLIGENARLRDSLALVKAAHDKTRQILGADVETVEDAAARVVRERDEARRELAFALELRNEAKDDAKRADEARRGVQRIIDDLTDEVAVLRAKAGVP